MDFETNADHEAIRGSVRALMARFPDSYWLGKDERHEYPQEFFKAFADAGFIGIAIPEEYGGSGLGVAEAGLVLQEVCASGAGLNGASAVHLSMFGINPVIKHGGPEMCRKYVPDVISGKLSVCFSVTEPDAGTDTTRITTRAERSGDKYIVNGRKTWLTKADQSQKVLLLTRTTPLADVKSRTDGMTLFLTDLDRRRVTIKPIRKLGRHAVSSNDVFFDDLEVPVEDRIGEEGNGFKYLLDGLNPERVLVAFEAIGIIGVSPAKGFRVWVRGVSACMLAATRASRHLVSGSTLSAGTMLPHSRGALEGRQSGGRTHLCCGLGAQAFVRSRPAPARRAILSDHPPMP